MMMRIGTRLHLTVLVALFVLLAPMTASTATAKDAIEKDLDLYWGSKRDVKVIQKRLFMKDGRFEFTLHGGVIPNDDFFNYGPLGLRVAYFIDEDFSIELSGAYIFSQRSELEEFLEDDVGWDLDVDLPQELEWYGGLNGLWSPIHGKFGLFTSKLAHFDLFLSFGVSAIGTKLYDSDKFGKRTVDIGGNLGAGFRFFILDWLAFRAEYRHYIYAADVGGVSYPAEISFGVSFFTAAPR